MRDDKEGKRMILVDALTDALGRSDGQSIEEVKANLRDEGIDVDVAVKRLVASVQKVSMAAKRIQLDVARDKRREMESKRLNLKGKFVGWSRDEVLARIKEITRLSGPDVSIAYRDLEARSTEDLKSLLEDLEMARYRSECEKGNNDT